MSMSSAGRAASSSDCVGRPRALEIGLRDFAVQIRPSSLTGSYAMATAEHREPYESRGSRTVLGAPGGESPPGDSTFTSFGSCLRYVRLPGNSGNARARNLIEQFFNKIKQCRRVARPTNYLAFIKLAS